jgi:acyl-CoA thioester hydrolase
MSAPATRLSSGRFEAGEHVFPLRVYYEDTDAGGIVYYGNYLRFAERARTELLRLVGLDQSELTRIHQVILAVRNCAVEFLAPARLDDLLQVRSCLKELSAASLTATQSIERGGETLARLEVRVACIRTDNGRPTRLPPMLRGLLQPYCESQPNRT